MSIIRNLTGQTFGRLTVISLVKESLNCGQHAKWNCICTCGTKKTVYSHVLLDGTTSSCGCYAREKTSERSRLKKGKSGLNRLSNHKGYIPANCVSCCTKCNNEKGSIGIKMIQTLYNEYVKGGILV